MIEVLNLTKEYGLKKALDDISFSINKGEILGFLGPNGAGKTTTMNIMTGYISATSGSVMVDGINALENSILAKKKIGYLPEQPPLYMDMTVTEYLSFVCELKGVKDNIENHIKYLMDMVKITDVAKRRIQNLSKGYKQRVGLASALVGDPEILILDEPTVGLDPNQIIEIRTMIKSLGKERTIIISSHILPEVEQICDKIIIINKGNIVADGTPSGLTKILNGYSDWQISAMCDGNAAKDILESIPNINKVTIQKTANDILESIPNMEKVTIRKTEDGLSTLTFSASDDVETRASVFNKFAASNYPIVMLKPLNPSLEDIFIKLLNDSSGLTLAEKADKEESK